MNIQLVLLAGLKDTSEKPCNVTHIGVVTT